MNALRQYKRVGTKQKQTANNMLTGSSTHQALYSKVAKSNQKPQFTALQHSNATISPISHHSVGNFKVKGKNDDKRIISL